MRKPEELLVLNYEYPPVGGGAGQVTENLCRFFAGRGIRQTVITGWVPGLKWRERHDLLTIIRVPMLKLRRDRTSVAGMASYLLTAFWPLVYVLMTRRPDLIHAHFAVPVGILALLAKRIFGTPYVITMHGGDVPGMVPEQTDSLFRWARGIARAVVRNAAVVTAVSRGLKALAAASYETPVEVIPNGIDPSWIDTPGGKTQDPSGVRRLIFVGRLTHQKNVSSLIQAVGLLQGDHAWRLDILGDGPLGEALRQEAQHLPFVHFHGWLPVEKVKAMLSDADIFLLPSFSEGLSIAALQAMARGCALIVSDIPMNRDVVQAGVNGHFCSHDPESIAAAIERCLPDLDQLKENSRQKAPMFLWDRIGDVYLSFFGTICEGKS
jgi:glycosyltransferase involved in cell wall biosynthesis